MQLHVWGERRNERNHSRAGEDGRTTISMPSAPRAQWARSTRRCSIASVALSGVPSVTAIAEERPARSRIRASSDRSAYTTRSAERSVLGASHDGSCAAKGISAESLHANVVSRAWSTDDRTARSQWWGARSAATCAHTSHAFSDGPERGSVKQLAGSP